MKNKRAKPYMSSDDQVFYMFFVTIIGAPTLSSLVGLLALIKMGFLYAVGMALFSILPLVIVLFLLTYFYLQLFYDYRKRS